MVLGINRHTPKYIWRIEAERRRTEVETLKKASYYLKSIMSVSNDRWSKVFLREEIRGMKNGSPSL